MKSKSKHSDSGKFIITTNDARALSRIEGQHMSKEMQADFKYINNSGLSFVEKRAYLIERYAKSKG